MKDPNNPCLFCNISESGSINVEAVERKNGYVDKDSENIHDLVWWQSKVMPLSGGKIQDSNSEGEEITIVKV